MLRGTDSLATSTFGGAASFFVNGERVELRDGQIMPSSTLAQFLRQRRLTGTKIGCGVGSCGACTVTLATWDEERRRASFRAVNSCLTPLLAVDGCHVITIEGIGSTENPHPLQEAFVKHHASQCGFCTPGFLMALYSNLKAHDGSMSFEGGFDGNLCRCTGYRPILDAAKSVAAVDFADCAKLAANAQHTAAAEEELPSGSKLVTSTSFSKKLETGTELFRLAGEEQCPSLGFPDMLKHRQVVPLSFGHKDCTWRWFAPTSLITVLELVAGFPRCRLYNGNTDFTERIRDKEGSMEAIISTLNVAEMRGVICEPGNTVSVGLAEPLASVHEALLGMVAQDEALASIKEFAQAVGAFASSQVRNWCGLGSLLRASDLTPLLMASKAEVVVQKLVDPCGAQALEQLHHQKDVANKPKGDADLRRGVLTEQSRQYFGQRLIGSRSSGPVGGPSLEVQERQVPLLRLELQPGEVAVRLLLPALQSPDATGEGLLLRGFRASMRRDAAFAEACAGLGVEVAAGVVQETCLVAHCFQRRIQLQKDWLHEGPERPGQKQPPSAVNFLAFAASLKGKPWPLCPEDAMAAVRAFLQEAESIEPSCSAQRGHYRKTLVASFLLDSFLAHPSSSLPLGAAGDTFGVPRAISSASQQYELQLRGGLHSCPDHRPLPETEERAPVGLPLAHTTALEQCTGEALYVDDLPVPSDCLWAAHVSSQVPKGRILGIDFSGALKLPGVYGYFDYRDCVTRVRDKQVPSNDAYKVFTSGMATAVGHCIGITVADTTELARKAAAEVRVRMEELDPVFTVQEAMAKNAVIPYNHVVEQGDVEATLQRCAAAGPTRIARGELEIGGQEHMYLEPHAVMAVPGEGGEMTIYSCTQCIHKTQKTVAEILGVPASKVVVRVKRLGGAFGGKEVLSTFLAARLALAARKLRRPVRMLLDRQEDMEISGQRHPFRASFEMGFDDDGRILAYAVDFYANAGHTTSITKDIMDRAISHAHNAYHIANFRARGTCCDTNWYSFTAFRGFGAPQAMLVVETALEMVAAELGRTVEDMRSVNLLPAGAQTPYGQVVERNLLKAIWDELWRSAEVESRIRLVKAFNDSTPRHRQRGLAVVPTKYGINFPVKFLNQSGALVCIYQQDGSVLVSHGGTEMGQGLNRKLAQIAAQALGCDISLVHIGESASDKVPNPSPTAASVGSDLNGMAVLDACEKIAARLKPYRTDASGAPLAWKQVVQKAYLERVSLFSDGFYATPDCCEYDWKLDTKDNSERGIMYAYHTFGACCAEVEVDLRTGQWACLRADMIMDVGSSLNPAIDIGQIEGAFVQGMGMYTLEELHWASGDVPWARAGTLVTNSPHSYKIPAASDVPCDFRVSLWPGAPNPKAVHSSKAVGEPPMFLSAAVYFAITQALSSANGIPCVRMDSPATAERIRMAFKDEIVREVEAVAGPFRAPALC